jgi:hypothetical protein
VWCPEGEVVIRLVPILEVRAIHGDVKRATIREIMDAVTERVDDCVAEWRRQHG